MFPMKAGQLQKDCEEKVVTHFMKRKAVKKGRNLREKSKCSGCHGNKLWSSTRRGHQGDKKRNFFALAQELIRVFLLGRIFGDTLSVLWCSGTEKSSAASETGSVDTVACEQLIYCLARLKDRGRVRMIIENLLPKIGRCTSTHRNEPL